VLEIRQCLEEQFVDIPKVNGCGPCTAGEIQLLSFSFLPSA
jgi:hypothetical protein